MDPEVKRDLKLTSLRYNQFTAAVAIADIFAADVPEDKMRFILAILFNNATYTDNGAVTVRRILEDNTTEDFIDSIPVPAGEAHLVGEIDINKPILVLAGGQNLGALRDEAPDIELTIWWIDYPDAGK